jgi:uncharacterized protein
MNTMNRIIQKNRLWSLSTTSLLQQQTPQLHLHHHHYHQILKISTITTTASIHKKNSSHSFMTPNHRHSRNNTNNSRRCLNNKSRINVVTPLPPIETTPWNVVTTGNPTPMLELPQKRYFSWTGARGYDLTNDGLNDYDKELGIPKINVSGYGENYFVVKNMVQKVNQNSSIDGNSSSGKKSGLSWVDVQSNDSEADSDGSVYMNGSIIVYPTGCFLWNIPSLTPPSSVLNAKNRSSGSSPDQPKHVIPIESLASIMLIRPHVELLFIGCNDGYGSISNLNDIQNFFRHLPTSINVEQMYLHNAIGTFNLLNAEDRRVAAALIVDSSSTDS